MSFKSIVIRRPSPAVFAMAIFLVLFFIFNLMIVKHNNSYCIKQNGFKFTAPRLECLVTGMSHAYYGVAPEELGCESMNLANNSQSLSLDCALVRKALEKCPKLKLVFMDISYHSLRYSMFSDPGEPWRDCYAYLYYGVSEGTWWQRICDIRYFVPAFLFGTQKCQKIVRSRFKDTSVTGIDETTWCTKRGWVIVSGEHKFTDEIAKDRVNLHNRQMREEFREKNLKLLDQLLADCNKRGVKVVLFTPPAWETYRKHMKPEIWQAAQGDIAALCEKHGCAYANYLSDSRFQQKDFVDEDHLMYEGAQKFSKILKTDFVDKYITPSKRVLASK